MPRTEAPDVGPCPIPPRTKAALLPPNALDGGSAAIRRAVDARLAPGASFAEPEQAALEVADEGGRRVLQGELEQIVADQGEQELLIDDPLYRKQQGSATYHSLVRPLPIERPTYRRVGVAMVRPWCRSSCPPD